MKLSVEQIEEALENGGLELSSILSAEDRHLPVVLAEVINAQLGQIGGQAGTHAYDVLATAAMHEAEVTSALVPLIVGMTMALKPTRDQEGNRHSVTFSPPDIDRMLQEWDYTVNRDGMISTVTIVRKNATSSVPTPLAVQDEDFSNAKPQVIAKEGPDRPYWFVRHPTGLEGPWPTQAQADEHFDPMSDARLENRNCPSTNCPNSAQHMPPCMKCEREVTSDVDKG